MTTKTILIDAREFVPSGKTGIGRFLEGLLLNLAEADLDTHILLATTYEKSVPSSLQEKKRVRTEILSAGFISSEKELSDLSGQSVALFLSPYPKLPLFGTKCPSLNTVHDVLDLTHLEYRGRLKVTLDRFRLRRALMQASLTWYVSQWSLKETERCIGFVGKNPKVRHSAIDERFKIDKADNEDVILKKYLLRAGYILVIGNGLPHKNLGVLLDLTPQLPKDLVFVGVPEQNMKYWLSRYKDARPKWIQDVPDADLPAIIRGAFCLVQPSTAEGYGFPPLEAMACGVPTVVSDIPALRETTGGNALYADPSDPKEWIEAIGSLEINGNYRNQLEKGLKWVEPILGKKGWHKHIADIQQLLDL
jgi:glycosyltransferase involved in cell wall biosynthesis